MVLNLMEGRISNRVTAIMGAFCLAAGRLAAGDGNPSDPADKRQYTLLHPTPKSLLREFASDRPDKTESPFTVDAGHFQIEMDLASFSYDHYNSQRTNVRVESLAVAAANMKLGLSNGSDLQLIIPTYNTARTSDRSAQTVHKNNGFGDFVSRVKLNFFGNDGGRVAFGTIAFVRFPTSDEGLGTGSVEGGIIFPINVKLPNGWEAGGMTQVNVNENSGGNGHHLEFVNSITFSHPIFLRLDGYAEFFSSISAEGNSAWIGTLDFGLIYALTENVRLDGGVNIGLTRAAPDLNPFLGISIRF